VAVRSEPPTTYGGDVLRILIADEQALFREAVRAVLEAEDDLHIVAEAGTRSFAVSEALRVRPDVALIDARLPGDGISTGRAISERVEGCRVLILASERDDRLLLDAVEGGVAAFLTKESALSELIEGVRRVVRGETVVPPIMLGPLLRTLMERRLHQEQALYRLASLTIREMEVLRLLVQGSDNEAIGAALQISPQTARTHVQHILSKLRVHSRLEAAAVVTQGGVLDSLEADGADSSATLEARVRRRWRTGGLQPSTH
jgi:DNA-binding NarL/FixJ family response regulator